MVKTTSYIHTRTQAQVHYACGDREPEMSGTEPGSVQEIFGQRIKEKVRLETPEEVTLQD